MKNLSMTAKQSLITILLGFLPFSLILISVYGYTTNQLGKEQTSVRYYNTQNIASALDFAISNYDRTTQYIISSDAVRAFLQTSAEVGGPEYVQQLQSATRAMLFLPFGISADQACGVFSLDGRSVVTGSRARLTITENEKERCRQLSGRWFWSVNGDSLSMCRLLRDKQEVSRALGYIKIVMEKESLHRLLSVSTGDDESFRFLLCDASSGALLIDSRPADDGEALLQALSAPYPAADEAQSAALEWNGTHYSVIVRTLSDGRTVLYSFSANVRVEFQRTMALLITLAVFLALVLGLSQILLFNRIMIRPLIKLGSLMESVQNEDFAVSFHIRRRDEISRLAARFNSMAARLNQLHNQVYQGELKMRAAEIKILEKEINPHFLFNTLNTIYWTIQVGNVDAAGRMMQDLSGLFRLSLYRSRDDLIPLSEEIRHMQCYLALEKMRLGDALEYSVDVQSGLENVRAVKLVLQPMVENAIVHGISPHEGGEITVSVYSDADTLCYMIYDDGVGAEPEKIRAILEGESVEGAGHGIALRNVHERIRLKFGPRYGVTYSRPADGGSVFLVQQPMTETEDEPRNDSTVDR